MTGTRDYDMVSLADTERQLPKRATSTMAMLPPDAEPKDEWADAEVGRLVRLTRAGWDAELIGETMDIPTREVAGKQIAISKTMEKRRLVGDDPAPKANRSKLTDEQKEELERCYEGGWTIGSMAKRFGLSYEGVRWILGKRGAM